MPKTEKKPLYFPSCKSDQVTLERISRDPLLRLIPTTKLYQCPACSGRYVKFLGLLFKV